jgi:hypothetical protein
MTKTIRQCTVCYYAGKIIKDAQDPHGKFLFVQLQRVQLQRVQLQRVQLQRVQLQRVQLQQRIESK